MMDYIGARPGKLTAKDKVLAHIPKSGLVNHAQLKKALTVSPESIYRVLHELEGSGVIKQVTDDGINNSKVGWVRV
jgi:DeoR/GlpR family transcriptional regulator of sugar metabolism